MFPGTHAATSPDKAAVIMAESGEVTTYAQLEDRSAQIAAAFRALGLERGDVVAVVTDNRPEVFEIYWACLRSGLYLTAINYHLKPAESAYIVQDSGARVLIVSDALAEVGEGLLDLVPDLSHRYSIGAGLSGYRSYADLLAVDLPAEPVAMPRGSDMLYSSGTTGLPKGIKPPLLGIEVDQPGDPITALIGAVFGVDAEARYLSVAPTYHAAPLRWCGAVQAHGGTVVMTRRFDAEQTLKVIENEQITHIQVVPTMFVRMLQLAEDVRARHDVSSLEVAVHAAAPCPPEVKDAMIEWWGPKLVEYYSSTEANGFTVINSQEWASKRGSVGRALLGVPHVCDAGGDELAAGEIGDLYFERDVLPFAYHNDPEKTAAAQHPTHPTWTTIGDIGYVDEDGYVFLTDRRSFVIISGGVNIYPQEIENMLTLHPAIHDVAVIGVPDAQMGQRVAAFVHLQPGVSGTDELAAELQQHVRDRLAGYKVPRQVTFVDELPRTATGKLLKREIPVEAEATV